MGASREVQWIEVTPTLDTSAYADGDVLFNSVEIPQAVFANGRTVTLVSIAGLDADDQGVAMDLVFTQAALTLAALNAAAAPADGVIIAAKFMGHIRIATGDYIDFTNSQGFTKLLSPGLVLEAASGSRSLYVSGINRGGTPTHTATGLVLKFGFIWH
jgi:hypothetical protein